MSDRDLHGIFIMISMKKSGEKIQKNFPAVGFHWNGGHIRFQGTHQGTYNFKTASPSPNAVKSYTRIEDI